MASHIRRRVGRDIRELLGSNYQDDPGSLAPGRPREIVNGRKVGRYIESRPGLAKIHTVALDGKVMGLYDPSLGVAAGAGPDMNEVGNPAAGCDPAQGFGSLGSRLYIIGRAPTACGSGWGSKWGDVLYAYSPEQTPKLQGYRIPRNPMGGGVWRGVDTIRAAGPGLLLHVGQYDDADPTNTPRYHRLAWVPHRAPNVPPNLLRTWTVAAPASPGGGQGEFGGYLGFGGAAHFMGAGFLSHGLHTLYSNPFTATMYVWRAEMPGGAEHGQAEAVFERQARFVVDDQVEFSFPGGGGMAFVSALATFREELVCAYGRYASFPGTHWSNKIRKRNAAGAWSDIALPATVSHFACTQRMAVYRDKLYIFGAGIMPSVHATAYGAVVLVYDGTSLSVAQNTISGLNDFAGLRMPVAFDGYLYYLCALPAATQTVYVGRFDGTTWNNTFKELTAQFPIGVGGHEDVLSLDLYRGALWAAIYGNDGASRLVASPGTSVSGTWTAEVSVSGNNLFIPPAATEEGAGPRASSQAGRIFTTAVL